MESEIPLHGGNAVDGVVKVGTTVRKPAGAHSAGVLAYLRTLCERGLDVPEPHGHDAQGRMVTEFVPGPLAIDAPPLSRTQLQRVGTMVRSIHDASRGLDPEALGLGPALIPTSQPDLVCHGDLTPWNLVLGDRWVFIDWDGAAASTRLWDLAYSAQAFTLNDAEADPFDAAKDLRSFLDGYGADTSLRAQLTETLPQRAWAMHALLKRSHHAGREPWGSMYVNGHGEHWRTIAQYLEDNTMAWRAAEGVHRSA